MNIDRVKELASMSYGMTSVDDQYADERCKWVTDPANKGAHMWWGQDQPYYRFLYLMAKELGGLAIEVGTHAGIGFSCLAAGAKASGDPKGWTIGIDKDNHGSAIDVAKNYKNCVFLNGISTDQEIVKSVEKVCVENKTKITIMFIDATHKIDWVNAEIIAFRHLFADEVVIIMDDCFRADNNTKLPECFEGLPGNKQLFPGLHTDNCIGVAIASKAAFDGWHPEIDPQGLTI